MLRGLYTSASGMLAEQVRNDIAANNLANVNTIGFKKDVALFKSFPEILLQRTSDMGNSNKMKPPEQIGNFGSGVLLDGILTDHSAGQARQTSRDFDLALEEDGYFVIGTPQGERYTRNGAFNMDANGNLVTAEGNFVLGQRGPIRITGREMAVDTAGRITVDGAYIDTLRVVTFDDKTQLQKIGDNLFTGGQPRVSTAPSVRQGYLESSNVNAITEMIDLIVMMRAYEANQRMITAQDSMLGRAVNDVGQIG